MNFFGHLWTHPSAHALGWALLHFVWQGALVALSLSAALSLLRARAANVRYAASCVALALMLLFPAITFLGARGSSPGAGVDEATLRAIFPPGSASAVGARASSRPEAPGGASATQESTPRRAWLTEQFELLLPWLMLGWVTGVLGLSGRALGGLLYARRLTRRGVSAASPLWRENLKRLSTQLRVTQTVALVESSLVRVPTVVGWLRPVIVLPASAVVGLTPQQLELILAHELAHIRRHDYLVNLAQVVAETLLFYHPAVWWVSRQIRVEREHVCDDLAVSACGDPVTYARALAKLERLRRSTPAPAVAADGGKLRERVGRLIERPQIDGRTASPLPVALFAAALVIVVAGSHNVLSHKKQFISETAENYPSLPALAPASETRDPREVGAEVFPRETASLIASDDVAGEDSEVRRVALAALGNRAGAVVVMNPRTGRVYTVVNQEWALRRGWNPASTFKLVTALAGIEDGVIDPAEWMTVSAKAGPLDLTRALALSNNSYFASLGERVGVERLLHHARRLGLGELTGINHAGESAGHLPSSKAVAGAGRVGAFGGGVEVTPIQLATLVSAIANGGAFVVPRVPRTPHEAGQFEPQIRRRVGVPRETLGRLTAGMIAAVEYGTGAGASHQSLRVAGKTGTFSDEETPVGVFASYAPADDPRLAVVVLTRGRGESGGAAAAVAGTIYRALERRS